MGGVLFLQASWTDDVSRETADVLGYPWSSGPRGVAPTVRSKERRDFQKEYGAGRLQERRQPVDGVTYYVRHACTEGPK